MSSPWLSVPLGEYEAHMGSAGVQQLTALSELFQRALDRFRPASVAVLGVAGGNGLEHIDSAVTKRIAGVDINPHYLAQVQRRFSALGGLELHCLDLDERDLGLAPFNLVHAALLFEHVGMGRALDNALSLIEPQGVFSVVLQLPSETEPGVAATVYSSMQALKQHFALIDVDEWQRLLERKGFRLLEQERRSLPAGKGFWFGAFTRSQSFPSCHPDLRSGSR